MKIIVQLYYLTIDRQTNVGEYTVVIKCDEPTIK
jgi:hypothetical protein